MAVNVRRIANPFLAHLILSSQTSSQYFDLAKTPPETLLAWQGYGIEIFGPPSRQYAREVRSQRRGQADLMLTGFH